MKATNIIRFWDGTNKHACREHTYKHMAKAAYVVRVPDSLKAPECEYCKEEAPT